MSYKHGPHAVKLVCCVGIRGWRYLHFSLDHRVEEIVMPWWHLESESDTEQGGGTRAGPTGRFFDLGRWIGIKGGG